MGVIALAARATQHAGSPMDGSLSMQITTDVWTALDCAYEMLDLVAAKLQDSEILMREAAHG
jgi:hypothetical protein